MKDSVFMKSPESGWPGVCFRQLITKVAQESGNLVE